MTIKTPVRHSKSGAYRALWDSDGRYLASIHGSEELGNEIVSALNDHARLREACELVDAEASQRIPFWEEDYSEDFSVEMSLTVKELRQIRSALSGQGAGDE